VPREEEKRCGFWVFSKGGFKDSVKKLMSAETHPELPASVPVMVLPGVTLFPNALLPLHIFEPRYRSMLEEALGSERMLAMAMPKDPAEEEVEEIAGVGLVRACIRNEDGTSNLILQGVHRVRFTGWEQTLPFRIGRIEPLPLHVEEEEPPDLIPLVTRLHALCSRFKEQGIELPSQFEAYLTQITDIGVVTDLVASTLITDCTVRQSLLEEISIPIRLRKLLEALRSQLA
jgi:ATP-dependent Lon protease